MKPEEIHQKWQESNVFTAPEYPETAQKRYVLDMFPYPSAQGLHVGHPEGYTATDIFARYLRMKGKSVLHPMGWDAFGLPAENYAIKTGVHPDTSTHDNINNFRRQIQSLGFSYDWSREVDTSSPEYYRWTQWMFLQMYKHGLAYRKKAKVNWCNTCQTVLANEQVEDGLCERSKDPVVQKDLEQWFFKITDYADQLLNDLDTIDWPERIKLMQRNWIGKKEGVTVAHTVADMDITLNTFSAYAAWLFADTFIVIAPEHPAVAELVKGTEYEKEVMEFVSQMKNRSTAERGDADKEKLGVFTGRYAIDPLNPESRMPIWLANFALMDFGTGVIRCSAHDVRDYEFAQKYQIATREVVSRTETSMPVNAHENSGVLTDSGPFTGCSINAALISEMIDWMVAQGIAERTTTYRLRDWLISRQRYWGAPIPVVYDPEGNIHAVKEEYLPLLLPTDVDYRPKGTSPLGSSESYKALAEKLYGKGWHFEIDTMDTFVCSSWYYLRYCDPNNTKEFASQESLKVWLPVDMYVGGAEHAVLHLLYARFFHKALQDFGLIPKSVGREPFKALRNQGMILGPDHQKMSKSRGNVINPDEVVNQYGADTLRMYEMFMGPFDEVKPWDTASIKGIKKFLDRVSAIVREAVAAGKEKHQLESRGIHALIQGVQRDIEAFRFNTAISKMMIYLNDADFVKDGMYDMHALKKFVAVLSVFAPFTCEELWFEMGESGLVAQAAWPEFDPALAEKAEVTMAVQINGKTRATFVIAKDASQDDAQTQALTLSETKKWTEGKQIKKVIVVPNKIVNVIVA
ncbi:MAG: leucine--tRNA ligase [Candidatus Kerfeldbacteria bacterium]|nr:leucine--tRNA ligase [Candidatus Kerfeldbacteria bacterium]